MRIRPLNDFVFLRQVKARVSPGGIVLPVTERAWSISDDDQVNKVGEVLAVGPGKRKAKKPWERDSMWDLLPGHRVAFSPNGNHSKRIDGEEVTVIRRDSIIGIVEDAHAAA